MNDRIVSDTFAEEHLILHGISGFRRVVIQGG